MRHCGTLRMPAQPRVDSGRPLLVSESSVNVDSIRVAVHYQALFFCTMIAITQSGPYFTEEVHRTVNPNPPSATAPVPPSVKRKSIERVAHSST